MNGIKRTNIITICVSVVVGIFAVSAMALMAVGIMEYKNIAVSNLENYELRTSVSYVATKLRQCDAKDSVKVDMKDNITFLRLIENSEEQNFETVIYHKDGVLYEYYHEAEGDFNPDYGFEVLAVDMFEISMSGDGNVILKAGNGEGKTNVLTVMLRCESSEGTGSYGN